MQNETLSRITDCLVNIAQEDLSIAETYIVKELIGQGYLVLNDGVLRKRVAQRVAQRIVRQHGRTVRYYWRDSTANTIDVPVYETIVVKKIYTIETDDPAIALAQAELGNTLRETHVENVGVIHREVGTTESEVWAQSNNSIPPLENFEVTVSVILQVDSKNPHTHKEFSDAAQEAISQCVGEAEQNGFVHTLANDTSIGVRVVKVTDTF